MSLPDGRHWSDVELDEVVRLDLSQEERALLGHGLVEWGGPARPTDAVARVIGFDSVDAMHAQSRTICERLRSGDAMTKRDWQRALIAVEIVWSSNFYGAGDNWAICTGWDDVRTIRVLRGLQDKLAGLRAEPWPLGER